MMKNDFFITFENGLPKGTAQQKGETIRYKNGEPYIQHYRKNKVSAARQKFVLRLKKYTPKKATEKPVRLWVCFYFEIKDRKAWDQFKPTRPDADGYVKEFLDAMTDCGGFWKDDAQVVDLRIMKRYAEKGGVHVWYEVINEKEADL